MIIRENESIEVLATLLKHKWVIIIFTLVLTIGSVFYAMNMDVQYKSTVNVVPPSNAADGLLGGALSGISSKLKDFGITKVAGGGSGGQSYDLSVLMESRTVLDSMVNKFDLIKAYKVKNESKELARIILRSNVEIVNYKEGNIEFSVWDAKPDKAAEMANEYVRIVNAKAVVMNKKEATANITYLEQRLVHTDQIITALGDSLSIYSKKYQIYSPVDQASVYSEALSELTATVMKAETEYEITKNKLGENDPYTVMLKDYVGEARKKLQESKTQPGLIGNFSLNDVSKVGMEYMRLYTEYEAHSKMKIYLMPTLEKTKLDLVTNNNYLFVVDEAIPAENKDRPKRSYIVMGTFAGSFILSIVLVLFLNMYNNLKLRLRNFKENQ
ncbi:MAG: Wzz/FepE/Etk N-terminal domain-containing protein [Candidatus Kapaibacterium sp.]